MSASATERMSTQTRRDSLDIEGRNITIGSKAVGHVSRDAEGHLVKDTLENRQLWEGTARTEDYQGSDPFGTDWHAKVRQDGSRIWVRLRNEKAVNGGVHSVPVPYNPVTGMNAPVPPRPR